jgi:SAM-dependent methyltransferase
MRDERCPVCDSPATVEFLRREQVPVQQNLVVKDRRAAEAVPRRPLRMRICERCEFVFNQAFDPSGLKYSDEYDNTQVCSPRFNDYVDGLVQDLVTRRGVRGRRIVEVGCGKGDFLRRLVDAPGADNTGCGFDRSYEGPLEDLGGRLRFERRFYEPDCGSVAADVVVCRHCVGYLPDPVGVLRTVRRAVDGSPHALVCFETQDVEWMFDHRAFFDFAYEVCSYFSPGSLAAAYARAGLAATRVRRLFGDQYLWVEGTVAGPESRPDPGERRLVGKARAFARVEADLRRALHDRLTGPGARGRTAVWGAGTKGASLVSLVDPGRELIACVVDLNPNKQGKYLPGTGHPIVDYRQLPDYGVTRAIVVNPNYREENARLLGDAGVAVELVALEDWQALVQP